MKTHRNFALVALLLLGSTPLLHSQVIDNTSTFRNIQAGKYFRFHYDNDYFTKMDQYYTQGITLEYVAPGLRHFPVNRILLGLPASDKKYGLTANLFGYTPDDTHSDAIVYGDRPFTSCLSLKTFSISTDSVHRRRLAAAFSVGIMGPAAFGEEIQVGIHTWLHNVIPKGWDNQLHNDVIINYQVNFEKELFNNKRNFLLNAATEGRLGTINTSLYGGFNLMFGHFDDPYRAIARAERKKWQYYFYTQSRLQFVGYNATLQGGLFNRSSPYTIPTGNIERFVYQADAGIVVNFKTLFLTYAQSFLTKEFSTGDYHRFGGVSLGVRL